MKRELLITELKGIRLQLKELFKITNEPLVESNIDSLFVQVGTLIRKLTK